MHYTLRKIYLRQKHNKRLQRRQPIARSKPNQTKRCPTLINLPLSRLQLHNKKRHPNNPRHMRNKPHLRIRRRPYRDLIPSMAEQFPHKHEVTDRRESFGRSDVRTAITFELLHGDFHRLWDNIVLGVVLEFESCCGYCWV